MSTLEFGLHKARRVVDIAPIPEAKHVAVSVFSRRAIILPSSSTVGFNSLEYLYLSPSGIKKALVW